MPGERIKIVLDTGNAAFEDSPTGEIARILEKLAGDLRHDGLPSSGSRLKDINGNTVGHVYITTGEE